MELNLLSKRVWVNTITLFMVLFSFIIFHHPIHAETQIGHLDELNAIIAETKDLKKIGNR